MCGIVAVDVEVVVVAAEVVAVGIEVAVGIVVEFGAVVVGSFVVVVAAAAAAVGGFAAGFADLEVLPYHPLLAAYSIWHIHHPAYYSYPCLYHSLYL